MLKVRNARDRWLSFEEEKALLDACIAQDNEAGWLRDVVIFALNTGMRQDEILALQWHHVDLFRKTAAVVRSKNGEKRTMPLNNRTFVLFKAPSSMSKCTTLQKLKRNAPPLHSGYYLAYKADERAQKRKRFAAVRARLKSASNRSYVESKLKSGWSPEQICM